MFRTFVDTHFAHLNVFLTSRLPEITIGGGDFPPFPLHLSRAAEAEADDTLVADGTTLGDLAHAQYSFYASAIAKTLQAPNIIRSKARAAWFLSSQFKGPGRWLCPPFGLHEAPHLTLSDNEYVAALRTRLLLAPFEDTNTTLSPTHCTCNTAIQSAADPFHSLDCRQNQAFYHYRHDTCRNVLYSFLRARLDSETTTYELNPLLHSLDGTVMQKQGDIAVKSVPDDHHVIDVTVSNPACATLTSPPYNAHVTTNAANIHSENAKRTKYADTKELQDDIFVPFAIEATGRIGPAAKVFINNLFLLQTLTRQRLGMKTPLEILQCQISDALTKCNARQILFHRLTTWQRRHRDGNAAT